MPNARDLSDAFAAVGDRWDDARLRRFVLACCERVRHLIPDGPVWELVAACSGPVPPAEMDRIWSAARDAAVVSGDFAWVAVVELLPLTGSKSAYFFADGLAKAFAQAAVPEAKLPKEREWDWMPDDPEWQLVWAAELSAQAVVVWGLFPEASSDSAGS